MILKGRKLGWLSGKAHSYKASLVNGSGTPLAQLEGQWTGLTKDLKGDLSFDANLPKEEVNVKSIDQQSLPESRKVWKDVADNIRTSNYDKAGQAKSKIENEQRQKRKDEAANNVKHQLKHFNKFENDDDYSKYIKQISSNLPSNEEGYKLKK